MKTPSLSADQSNLYFRDPRLRMTLLGRFLVRVSSYVSYLVLGVSTFTFLISPIGGLRYLGVLLLLFLLDRLIHKGEADRPLYEIPEAGQVNLVDFLRPSAFSVIEKAYDRSLIKKTSLSLEVIRQLLALEEVKEGLERMDLSVDEVKQKIDEFLPQPTNISLKQEEVMGRVEILVMGAHKRATSNNYLFIEPSDLFSAVLGMEDELTQRLFSLFAIEEGDLEKAMAFGALKKQFSRFRRQPRSIGELVRGPKRVLRHRIMNRAWTSRPTPTLDSFSYDLTDLARQEKVGFLIGHKEEYERLVDTLARPINPNALLIGETGVGKETLVSHLAFEIVKDKVPTALFDKRLVALELSNLVAGADADELQERLQEMVDEIIAAGNVILYIPEIHNLVRTSGTAYLSAADALMPIIMDNAFQIIGTTYPREFKEFLEPRSDFVGVFEKIHVNEITTDEAERILVSESLILERDSKILISFGAIKESVRLAKKYFRNKLLPSSADELLKGALVEAKRRGERKLGPELVVKAAEAKVNIPIHEASAEEAKKLLNLESIIHERLVDQEEAVKAVSNVLREYRSGLTRPGGPIASFLFVGPTGVGKTELAKILTKIQFGSIDLMIRFDMTEYQDKQSFYRFIGSPDGKIFGALTEAVSKKPYSLVLLDEFEKAYPDILDLFLQVFDDGRLTDNLGRLIDFEHTIIIATSNAHSDIINEALRHGQTMSQIGEYLKRKLTDVFKPELLNRFSKTVVFNSLSPKELREIATINLADFARVVGEQGIALTFNEDVVREVARLGYDPSFGARPLQRVIEEKLRAPLAEKILRREVAKGGKYKTVLVSEGIFGFEASQ